MKCSSTWKCNQYKVCKGKKKIFTFAGEGWGGSEVQSAGLPLPKSFRMNWGALI